MIDDAALAEAPDPAILRAERRLQILEELTDIAMNLARALERQALAAADRTQSSEPDCAQAPIAPAFDPSVALARISRAVRLTLALEARTDEQLRALRAGVAAEVEARRVVARNRAREEARARRDNHRDEVERLVWEAAEREAEDEAALDSVLEALEERLTDDEAYWDLDQMPVREAVQRLCADLELTPDWSLWEGEGWTPQPPFSRGRFSLWSRPSRTPLRPHEDLRAHPRE
ncbi:MAG TPA: hypothetical protein VGH03_21840 [Caulobacteraceae bacterium]|jgi:hypothetical protein